MLLGYEVKPVSLCLLAHSESQSSKPYSDHLALSVAYKKLKWPKVVRMGKTFDVYIKRTSCTCICFNDLFSATNRISPIFTNLLRVLEILINIIMCMTGTLQRWHNIFFSLLLVIDYNLSAIRVII